MVGYVQELSAIAPKAITFGYAQKSSGSDTLGLSLQQLAAAMMISPVQQSEADDELVCTTSITSMEEFCKHRSKDLQVLFIMMAVSVTLTHFFFVLAFDDVELM